MWWCTYKGRFALAVVPSLQVDAHCVGAAARVGGGRALIHVHAQRALRNEAGAARASAAVLTAEEIRIRFVQGFRNG